MTDRSFLTDGRPYLNAKQAAEFVGYDHDKLRAFYDWTYRHGVKQTPGAGLYRRADLEAAIEGTAPGDGGARDRLRAMARADLRRGPQVVGRRRSS